MSDSGRNHSGKNSFITFLVSLIAGAIGIHVGAMLIIGSSSIATALIVALVGAFVWGVASFFLGWMPLIGSLLTFIVWLGAINWFYPGEWITAAQIAFFAWVASLILVYLASAIGLTEDANAVGVPNA